MMKQTAASAQHSRIILLLLLHVNLPSVVHLLTPSLTDRQRRSYLSLTSFTDTKPREQILDSSRRNVSIVRFCTTQIRYICTLCCRYFIILRYYVTDMLRYVAFSHICTFCHGYVTFVCYYVEDTLYLYVLMSQIRYIKSRICYVYTLFCHGCVTCVRYCEVDTL